MDFQKLARKAQQIYKERGGAEAARGDAAEVEQILHDDGSLADKAKRAAQALKQPGAADAAAKDAPPAPGGEASQQP